MYREGDWKIVRANGEEWELYDISEDMSETNNLASTYPEMIKDLVSNCEKRMSAFPE
jgi:arylsulfatase